MQLSEVIERCIRNERAAQNYLFDKYAPFFKSICLRYLKSPEIAEDILIQGFYKIFNHMAKYKHEGSFEGWMKKIIVNECLMELRKRKNMSLTVPLENYENDFKIPFVDHLTFEEILNLLDELPIGYRTVFNLFVIEGYKHREIADKLGISINTSKSQLILARRKLQGFIKKKWKTKIA